MFIFKIKIKNTKIKKLKIKIKKYKNKKNKSENYLSLHGKSFLILAKVYFTYLTFLVLAKSEFYSKNIPPLKSNE